MSWLSEKWKGVERGWKDLWDPGRESRKQLEGLYNQQMGQQQNLIGQAQGMNAQNQGWAAKYLQALQGAPDMAFNQGASALERGIADTESAITKRMAQRGILGSGVDLGALAGSGAARARGLSALQGQRVQGQVNNAGQAFNLMSGVNTDAYNMLNNAYNSGQGALSSYMNYLGQDANSPSPVGQLLSTAGQAYLGSVFPPAGMAMAASGGGATIPGADKGASAATSAATRQMMKRLAMAR